MINEGLSEAGSIKSDVSMTDEFEGGSSNKKKNKRTKPKFVHALYK